MFIWTLKDVIGLSLLALLLLLLGAFTMAEAWSRRKRK